jgi:hypothetical protein
MNVSGTIAVWLILMLLLGLELLVRGVAAVAIGGVMATFVALTYMRLVKTGGTASAFALAAVFWLMVMFGLGSMDPATRHDVGVARQTPE